jgi:hypothetical protein
MIAVTVELSDEVMRLRARRKSDVMPVGESRRDAPAAW